MKKEQISLEENGIIFDVVFSWDNDDKNERGETIIHTIKIGDTPNLYDVLHEDVIYGLYDQLEAM